MALYNKLTKTLERRGIRDNPIVYLNSHVIVTLDISIYDGTTIDGTIIDNHFNQIVSITSDIIKNLLKLQSGDDINAIVTIKLNIEKYKELKQQFKQENPDYVDFLEDTYQKLELFNQSFEEAFPTGATAQYQQYCYES